MSSHLLSILHSFSEEFEISFWLEGGTALGIYRSGEVLPWDHDIDFGCKKEALPSAMTIKTWFNSRGVSVKFQKGLGFFDNLIQLDANSEEQSIDLYCYTKAEDKRVMRWASSPINLKGKIYLTLYRLCWSFSKRIGEPRLALILRLFFLDKLIETGISFAHEFQSYLFDNLEPTEVQGYQFFMVKQIESFLEARYGPDFMIPDPSFNQRRQWQKMKARPIRPMSILAAPEIL